MRHIKRIISISDLLSRYDGTVPYAVDVWYTDYGKFYVKSEAIASALRNGLTEDDVKHTMSFADVDLSSNPIGNRGHVPCDIPTSAYTQNPEDSDKTTSYNRMMSWYRILKEYYGLIGDYSTAEEYYIMNIGVGKYSKQDIEVFKALDKVVEEINNRFYGIGSRRAYDWMNEHMFSKPKTDSIFTSTNRTGYLSIPVMITSDIDELGEMSIFSNEYVEDRWKGNDEIPTVNEGDVFSGIAIRDEDGLVYELNDTYYVKNPDAQEISDKFELYADHVMKQNNELNPYILRNTGFCVNDNDEIVLKNNECDSQTHGYERVKFDNGFVIIDGNIVEVKKSRYVVYSGDTNAALNGRKIPVHRLITNPAQSEIEGNQYWCAINGLTYISKGDRFYFKTHGSCNPNDRGCPIQNEIEYIEYGGGIVIKSGNTITINDGEWSYVYSVFDSYVDVDGPIYYIKNNNMYKVQGVNESDQINYIYTQTYKEFDETDVTNITISDNYVYITYKTTTHDVRTLTGFTSSKLDMLKDIITTTDRLGNTLPGGFEFQVDYEGEAQLNNSGGTRVNTRINEPYNGMRLEFPYHVGNTNEISYDEDSNTRTGDLLSKIEILGYDINGDETYGSITIDINSTSTRYINNIEDDFGKMSEKIESVMSANGVERVIMKFTYHLTADLVKKQYLITNQSIQTDVTNASYYVIGKNSGITYEEQYLVKDRRFKYYVDEDTFTIVKYFDIEPLDTAVTMNNDYGKSKFIEKIAKFSFNPDVLELGDNRYKWSNEDFGYDPMNGMTLAPTFRQEYMNGITIPQNIDGNIYIDRGINSAFEKKFKLNDIRSIDSLTYYGNKWFNVVDEKKNS